MRVLRVSVPHDCLYLVACAAVVQTFYAAAVDCGKSASPQRCCATPRSVYVVHHVELVLHHVAVRIDGLVGVARKLLAGYHVRCPVVVRACLPRRAVTAGAANLHEHLLALLHTRIVEVAGARNGKTAMPYHELVEVVGRHLRLEVVPLVAELVGAGLQQSVHTLAYLVVGRCPERRCRVVLYLLYHLLVLSHCRSPSVCGVEFRTVGTCHVRDVPDGVGARTVLQRGTCQSVGEALHHRLAVAAVSIYSGVLCGCIPCARSEVVGRSIPEVRVNVLRNVSHLCYVLVVVGCRGILRLDVLFSDGIEQTRTHHADCRLYADSHCLVARVVRIRVGAERRARYCHLRIDKVVSLAVRELHRQAAFHRRNVMPLHVDLALVDRCLEGFGGLCLRHTSHFSYVATVVAVGSVYGMIHSEQIAVAIAVGCGVRVHAAAMSVVGVAVETRTAHRSRTESLEARIG